MRLKEIEIKAIKDAVEMYDKDAKVYLFGSRVDDSKRGGDIDIIISSDKIQYKEKLKIYSEIMKTLDEQKIDILIHKNKDNNQFISDSIGQSILL